MKRALLSVFDKTGLVEKMPAERVIVMGDFNATPESAAIQAMRKVLVDSGPASTPTWSVYPEGCRACNPQAIDTRLDYIFTSKDLKLRSFEVGNSRGSDHRAISAIVEL
jgi:endonuclease/exonuclease/phosphatase family metal-dependent hydrolase